MKLTLQKPFLSILSFPEVALPRFTLVTGVNGAGKSHLLRAIEEGSIGAEGTQLSEIHRFDWTNMVPQDTGIFQSETINNDRMNVRQHYESVKSSMAVMGQVNQAISAIKDPELLMAHLRAHGIRELNDLNSLGMSLEEIARVRTAIEAATTNILNQVGPYREELQLIAESVRRHILFLREADFMSAPVPSWGRTTAFQQQFARLFVQYRNLKLSNDVAQHAIGKGKTGVNALSDEEFVARFGRPPWDFVNAALADAGLDFEINAPDEFNFAPYHAKLRKRSNHVDISFDALSSGEKILLSFAFCVYYASDRRQISTFPKLLLLDEVDAPLHPMMARTLISTITKTLIAKYGITVIATTHSPSTVALAPETALHVMEPGTPGLRPVSKAQALNVLMVGVPTLSLSYEGRRQVFVESPADAKTYDLLYQRLKRRLRSERSLEFIATGIKKGGADANTGCEVVVELVGRLAGAGNSSVFGLVDWDGWRQPSHRIAVLAEGKRNGLENVLLDPLLVAAAIIREGGSALTTIGVDEDETLTVFLQRTPEQLQPVVDRVQEAVLTRPIGTRVSGFYIGEFSLRLDESYLMMDDHALEDCVLAAFPLLKAFAKPGSGPGRLMQHIVSHIVAEQPSFAPSEVANVFLSLLEAQT